MDFSFTLTVPSVTTIIGLHSFTASHNTWSFLSFLPRLFVINWLEGPNLDGAHQTDGSISKNQAWSIWVKDVASVKTKKSHHVIGKIAKSGHLFLERCDTDTVKVHFAKIIEKQKTLDILKYITLKTHYGKFLRNSLNDKYLRRKIIFWMSMVFSAADLSISTCNKFYYYYYYITD